VIGRQPDKHGCNCGARVQVMTGALTSGNTRSCGCGKGYRSDVHGGFQ
jgi:hypothetical protein